MCAGHDRAGDVDSFRPVEGVTLRVAFIGAGQMARHHLRAIARLEGPPVVVGVYDRAPGRAEEFATLARTRAFPSVQALLADARPDVVHVCTPADAHVEAAYAVLDGGAHVYVEKPFALTARDARSLIALAQSRKLLVCAGHQLLCDRAFETLLTRALDLGTLVHADSHFAFQPVAASVTRGQPRTLARQLVDVVPHPLYTLVRVLERFTAIGQPIELAWAHAEATDLQAVLRAGRVTGRLSVSLRARPVASSLMLIGTEGSLTCDFIRSIVFGAVNPGTEALEKVLNPIAQGGQLIARAVSSLARRVRSRTSYPGLHELLGAFYRAVADGGVSPVSPDHLLRVAELFEDLVARIEAATAPSPFSASTLLSEDADWRTRYAARNENFVLVSSQGAMRATEPGRAPASRCRVGPPGSDADARLVVVTGAGGFLGSAIARTLKRVRGIGRTARPDDADVQEWVTGDLSSGLPAHALAGADVVVHAAAETAGSYDAHQRNTIDATRNLLHAMHSSGVSRLVLVSSLSVLRPPRTPWERQDERTSRPRDARPLGPYAWGKCLQEELVEREAATLGIATRIIRPAALVDWQNPVLPALTGRRLFGGWHLGIGRPGLPVAVCDVERCAEAIRWCVAHFDDAPPVVNLIDPAMATRGELIARLRARGWSGRMVWVPISFLALGLTAARAIGSLGHDRSSDRLAPWAILRPRRFDTRRAAAMFEAATRYAPEIADC
jgi:predicted dehydrogenase/nucleoside-diphosphate-sugar epimerase